LPTDPIAHDAFAYLCLLYFCILLFLIKIHIFKDIKKIIYLSKIKYKRNCSEYPAYLPILTKLSSFDAFSLKLNESDGKKCWVFNFHAKQCLI
jgi:hypothetical protein